MQKLSMATLALALITLSGCIQTKATMLSSRTYPPIDPSEVTIYMNEDEVPGRFERVAIITSAGNTQYSRQDQMYESIRAKAAEIGANGVIFAEIDEPSTGAKIAGAVFGVGTNRQSEMVAIFVYHEEPTEGEGADMEDEEESDDQ